MNMISSAASIAALILPLSGCAGIEVAPIPDNRADQQAQGFRYYPYAPFLFVHSDGKGGLTSQIIYLPDTTQKMSVRPYAYLSSNDSTFTFENGVLTEGNTVVDETVVPAAAVDALAKVASAAIKAANLPTGAAESTVPVPYLFKIVVTAEGVTLKGGPFNGASLTSDQKNPMTIHVAIPQ